MRRTGLYLYGDLHPQSKLTWEQVDAIRKAYENGEKQIVLARQYKVSQSLISKIVNGHSWGRRGVTV